MNAKSYLITVALVFMASCDAPTEMSEMREIVDEQLITSSLEMAGAVEAPIALSQGLAPALLTAVLTNEAYLAALALEAEAMGQVGMVASVRRPQLTSSANIGGIRETVTNAVTTTGVAGGLNLSQLVYDGGASTSAMNRSTAMALSAQADRMVQGNEIALSAAQAWIGLWQYSERLRLMKTRTSEMDMLVQQIERMARNGMLDKASLENVQRQIVDIKLEESRLIAGQSEAQVLFYRFFNTKPTTVPRASEIVSTERARIMAKDWETAPVLQRQAAELLAAQAAVGEAKSAFKPRARLQASARSPLERGVSTELMLGFSLEYSFSDGGRRQAQLETAQARVVATEAQLINAQRGLEAELEAGLIRLASIERAMPLLVDKLRLSGLEAETSRSQMLTGQSNLRQLVEAEIAIYRAQDEQIAMQAERQTLLLTIAARTGALGQLVALEN